ncbi:MAG: glycosyltransferase [Candidatus Omnitrophota bacterium]
MRKIKIMHLLLSLDIGGAETRVALLANSLDKEKFDFSVGCLEKTGKIAELINKRVKVFVMHKKPGIAFWLPFKLYKLFRQEKIDILHTHGFVAIFYGLPAAVLAGVRVVIQGEQGDIFEQVNEKRLLIARKLFSFFVKRILANSSSLKETVKRLTRIKGGKFKVIYNGVDTEKFKVLPANRLDLIQAQDNEVIVGTVGRLASCKNYEMLVRAFALVRQKRNNIKLVFIGDGLLRGSLQALVSDLGINDCVQFLGARADIPKLLNILDIFVLPSFAEGCSNAVLEAMASGLPVIASDTTSNRELVQNSVTGILFSLDDINNLAGSIINLAQNKEKREEMGKAGRRRAEEYFSLGRMIQEYTQFYLTEAQKCIR